LSAPGKCLFPNKAQQWGDEMNTAISISNVGARLDRLPISGFHRRLGGLIAAGMFFDGFDLFLGASVIAAMAKSGFSNLQLNSYFVTATFIGMTIGAFFSGFIGDRYGRRVTYQLNLLIFGAASVAAALAPDMKFLIGARFIMGIGLGAEIVVGYATYTEFLPPVTRGKWLGLLALPVQCAIFIGALIGLLIIPTFGWRPMFWIAAIGAGVVWFLRKNIPESPRWLEKHGRSSEADAIVRSIEAQSTGPLPHLPISGSLAVERPPISLLNPQLLLRILVAGTALVVVNVVGFGFLTFVPTFFVKAGNSITTSLSYSAIMMSGGPIGGLIALLITDKVGRRWTIIGSGLLSSLFGCFYPFVGIGFLFLLCGFFIVTTHYVNSVSTVAIYMPELFPTDVRLRATGICHTAARLAAAAVPVPVMYFYSQYGVISVIIMMTTAQLIQAIVVFALGVEPTDQSLEAIEKSVEETEIKQTATGQCSIGAPR
jgi:putative MFS transporter